MHVLQWTRMYEVLEEERSCYRLHTYTAALPEGIEVGGEVESTDKIGPHSSRMYNRLVWESA